MKLPWRKKKPVYRRQHYTVTLGVKEGSYLANKIGSLRAGADIIYDMVPATSPREAERKIRDSLEIKAR